jgi:hypothetical protein
MILFFILIAVLLNGGPVFADSSLCSTQGFAVESASGTPVEGDRSVTVRFYAAASGGTALAEETKTVTFSGGVYNVSFDCQRDLIGDNTDLFLEIEIESDILSPRLELVSVPYAQSAFSVGGSLIVDDDGNIGIRTVSPSESLHVDGGVRIGGSFPTDGTTLAQGMDATQTTATLTSVSGFPPTGTVVIEQEAVSYTGIDDAANTLTGLSRGFFGTTALAHAAGTAVVNVLLAVVSSSNTPRFIVAGNGDTFILGELSVEDNVRISGNLNVSGTVASSSSCPSGYQNAGNYCIETNERDVRDWTSAASTCRQNNAQLCTAAQWYAGCNDLSLNNETNNREWVSDLVSATDAIVMGNGSCGIFESIAMSGGGGAAFRCCQSK